MPAKEFFETAVEKAALVGWLRDDVNKPITSLKKYAEQDVMPRFMKEYPGSTIPLPITKNGKLVGLETPGQVQERLSRRPKVRHAIGST